MDPLAIMLVAGNLIALVTGFVGLVGWFRRWLRQQVSEPVQMLTTQITQTSELAQRANDRLDRHLESHNG